MFFGNGWDNMFDPALATSLGGVHLYEIENRFSFVAVGDIYSIEHAYFVYSPLAAIITHPLPKNI